jgi:hypothetical protein
VTRFTRPARSIIDRVASPGDADSIAPVRAARATTGAADVRSFTIIMPG